MNVAELVNKLKAEQLNTWFDLGLFLDRLKVQSAVPSTRCDGDLEEFHRTISSGVGFVTFDYGIDGVTMEIVRYAKNLYRRAVAGDPQSAEARLRLGRVLEKQGHYREAEAPLEAVLRIGASDYLDYFAHLFLGRLSERAGSVGEAIDHYRAATRLLPHWQVGFIALAHALRVSGRRDEARATVARAVAMRPPFAQLDGWWVYERGRCGLFVPLLKRLREEVAL